MKKPKSFSTRQRLLSFKFAFRGLTILLREEHNARIHVVAAVTVIAAGFCLNLNSTEWIFVLLCIALVFTSEAFNSAIENLADMVSLEKHPQIKKIKDLSAAAVLIIAVAAAVVGSIIFLPKVLVYFN